MIITLSGKERSANATVFRQLFAFRYDVFVKRRHWSLPARGNLDIDQYDCPEAQYFYGVDDDGSIFSHVRLTPTMTHSLMADYFPHLVEGRHQLRDPLIYEATRYIVMPREKSRARNCTAKAELLGAVMQWSLERGLTHLQTVIDTSGFPSFIELSPETLPLGLSHPYGGGPTIDGGGDAMAIRCPVSQKVVEDILAYGDLPKTFATGSRLLCEPMHA